MNTNRIDNLLRRQKIRLSIDIAFSFFVTVGSLVVTLLAFA